MSYKYWLHDENFKKLCDIVASNRLICLTGSGISTTLKLKNGDPSPDWRKLLNNISQTELKKKKLKDARKQDDLKKLLSDDAEGEQLIEAASILYNADKRTFNKAFSRSVSLKRGETSEVHKRLLNLEPRGILTYNYDVAHENAIYKHHNRKTWPVILPSNNQEIIDLLKNNFQKPFLFKMHGTIGDVQSMILTRESYRDLFNKYPYYKAFMQHIFTNYQLLIIGFGLSDPDFESLLQNVFSTFGSPIQEHIVIKHIDHKSSKDTLYRLRYGLNFLYVNDFEDIPKIINDCTKRPGIILQEILEKCISDDLTIRSEAHNMVRALSNIGKSCLANILEYKILKNMSQEKQDDYQLNTQTSEYVYTYGVIAGSTKQKKYKDFLINNVVDKSCYSEPVAHALFHLRDALDKNDINTVRRWITTFKTKKFKEDPQNTDPHNRVFKYTESIYYYLYAKYPELNNLPNRTSHRHVRRFKQT